jgi:NACHT domain
VLKWLVTTDPSGFHNSTYALREGNTGLWLHNSPEYNSFKEGMTPLIWFYGIPGAGKSVLFSYIVEDIKAYCKAQLNESSVCIYYYCYFGRNQDESTHLIRWTISQLARQLQYLPSNISQLFDSGEQPALPVMMDALAELSALFNQIYLLIDGLDESVRRVNLLQVLESLNTERFDNIKILAMSREEVDIKIAMKDVAQALSLHNSYVDKDIATYVRSELTGNARLRVYPLEVKQEIETALVKGACGM